MDRRTDEAIRRIVNALNGRGCLPFVGAGFSAWEGANDPKALQTLANELPDRPALDGDEAIQHVLTRAVPNYEKKQNHQLLPCQRIADLKGAPPTWFFQMCLLSTMDKQARSGALKRGISSLATLAQQVLESAPDKLSVILNRLFAMSCPNPFHRKISLLPFDVIATTNYDGCLEVAQADIGTPLKSVHNDKSLTEDGVRFPALFKLHGDLYDPQRNPLPKVPVRADAVSYVNRVVLTDRQYWDFPEGRELMMDYLRVLFASRQVVFLGYSIRDFNIIEVLHRLSRFKGKVPEPILLVRDATVQEIQLCRARGIELVTGDLWQFLSKVWTEYFGVPDPGTVEVVPPPSYKRSEDLCLAVLMHLALCEDFRDRLGKAVRKRAFHRSLFAQCAVWNSSGDRFETFQRMRWLRATCLSPHDSESVFYEFPVEVRQRVLERLRKG
jgi:hypothetical protein